ncbi:hypothetical protein [uncultured Campylobacter sp.]|nr:hypothetical protein [uncultured Campylobacter sp.]
MSKTLEYLILAGLIVSAVVCAWAVLTANHLTIG